MLLRLLAPGLALLSLPTLLLAQCPSGIEVQACQGGACNSDPNAVDYLQLCVAPVDGACEDTFNGQITVIFTDTSGVVSTVSCINPATSIHSSAYYWDFNVPQSAIMGIAPTLIRASTMLTSYLEL